VSKTGEKLLEDALKLSLSERAELAAELLASLDGARDEDAAAAWAAEIDRRAPGRGPLGTAQHSNQRPVENLLPLEGWRRI
jgi:hypothetical protein